MVDLSTTISSFESEVLKALRVLNRKLKEGKEEQNFEQVKEALKFQTEKKLKEVFEYYKTKIPLDILAHKLLDFGKKLDLANLYALSTQECYNTILESKQASDICLPFPVIATAFYRKSICDCELLTQKTRGFRSGTSVGKLTSILDRVQNFVSESLKSESHLWSVFNGTVVLYNICRTGTSKGLGRIVMPYLIFAVECLDCIEMLYVPKQIGWYVQLCIAIAECCDTTNENDAIAEKNVGIAQIFLKRAKEQVQRMKALAKTDSVQMEPELVKLIERATFRLSLHFPKYNMEEDNSLEETFPQVGDRMLALLLALQKPKKRTVVHHYTPEEDSRESKLLAQLSETFKMYLDLTKDETLKFRNVFTNLDLEFSQGYDSEGRDVRPRKFSRHQTLADMLGQLCRTFYLYEQWEDFESVCDHVHLITTTASSASTAQAAEEGGCVVLEDGGKINAKALLDGHIAENLRTTSLVLKSSKAVAIENGSQKSIKDLANALTQEAKYDDVDLAIDVSILLCKYSQRIVSEACKEVDRLAINTYKMYKQKKKMAQNGSKHSPSSAHSSSAKFKQTQTQKNNNAMIQTPEGGEYNTELIAVAKCALLSVVRAFSETDFDDISLRLRTAIQFGTIVERLMYAGTYGYEANVNDEQDAVEALLSSVQAGDDFRSECMLSNIDQRSSPEPFESQIACLQVDAISLQFRIQLTTARYRDRMDKQSQPVTFLRMTENKIANLCNKNVYWLSLFYMQYACVHNDRSKTPSFMLESIRHLQGLSKGEGKSKDEPTSPSLFSKGDELVLPPPDVVMITASKAVISFSKPAKGPAAVKDIQYFSIDCKASSGTSVRALGQKENQLVAVGDFYTVKNLQTNQSYVFTATYYDEDGKKVAISMPTQAHCACNPLSSELLWCYAAITCARLANDLSLPMYRKLPSLATTVSTAKGSSSLIKLMKIACKHVKDLFRSDMRGSEPESILNPVDTVQMNKNKVPKMPQAMLRALASVMFCESDMLHNHKPIADETKIAGSKLILDVQVKTMMQAKHALMAFELGCLINDRGLCFESLVRTNNILVRLVRCRTRSAYLVKLVSSFVLLINSHFRDSPLEYSDETRKVCTYISALLVCEVERIYRQVAEEKAGSKLVEISLQLIKQLCKDLAHTDYQLYGAKKAFNVLQLKGIGDFVDDSINDEIPIPIVSLAKQVLHEKKGPDGIPDLITSAIRDSSSSENANETLHVMIYILSILLKDSTGMKLPLASKVAEQASEILEAWEGKAVTMLEPLYTSKYYLEQEAADGDADGDADGGEDENKPSKEEMAQAREKAHTSKTLIMLLRRRSELRKARGEFFDQCQLWSRVLLLASNASEYTHDQNIVNRSEPEDPSESHQKVMQVLHLSCIAAEMTSRFCLGNLFRAACVQVWNCCCKFNLFDQVDSLPEDLKDDLLVVCNRLMDFVFDLNTQQSSELIRGHQVKGTDNIYFQYQRNVATSFEGPNVNQDLDWLAKMQDATFVALLKSQGSSRTKDVLRLGAEYIEGDREKKISAYSLKSVLQHLVSIISTHGELIPDTPDYIEKLYKMEKTSSVCFNNIEACRDLAFRSDLMLTYEAMDGSGSNTARAIKEYSSCIPLLRQMDEVDLMMEALQELADLTISVGNEKIAKRTLNELLDSIFGEFQTITNWRSKFFQNKDDNRVTTSSAEFLIRQIGEKRGILAISVLGKLLNLSHNNDLYISGECAMLAALVSRAILASSFRHPSYLCDFARYTAPRKLCENIDLIHMPRFASIVDLLLGLESIVSTLLNRKAFIEALPVLVLADHCIIQYTMSEQARVKGSVNKTNEEESEEKKEGEEGEEGEEPTAPQNRPLIWREGMIMHFRALRIKACIELGFFNASSTLLLPILKASQSLEALDALTEDWLYSDTNHLSLSLSDNDGVEFQPSKAVADKYNAKALFEISSIKIGSAFRERFGIAAEMEVTALQSQYLINISSCINFPVDEKSTPDKTYTLDESCSVPKLMEAAQNVIENILNEESTEIEPSKRIFDTEGRLVQKCQMLLQYANMKRSLCEPRVAIELLKKAGSTLQSISDNSISASDPQESDMWLPMKNDLTEEIWLECMVTLMHCYADLGNVEEALSLCRVLSSKAFHMKAYNALVHMEHIKASLNLAKGDSEATIQGYKTAIMLIDKHRGCITPEQNAVLICDYAVALEALEGDLHGAREQWGWAVKVFESQSGAQGFTISLQHSDRINLFCRSTPLYLNALMNYGRIDVLLAQSGTVDAKHYAKQAMETFNTCHSKAPYCALDAHIQASMHIYTGCASAILGDFQKSLSHFEIAFSWFTTGDFSDPGLLRLLMICSAQSTFDHFHNKSNFTLLIQYAAKVAQALAASRAPEHFGVHLSDKEALPKAINMHLDRYNLNPQNLSEVNKDKRAAAMYASRVLQVAMSALPSMLPMSFTLVKKWNVLGSIVAEGGLNMGGGLFDLTNEEQIQTVRSLILGGQSTKEEEGGGEEKKVAAPPVVVEPKPGTICFQYIGTSSSVQQEQQESSRGNCRCNLLLFYAVLPDSKAPSPEAEGQKEEKEGEANWCCGYGRVDWKKLNALKDVLVSVEKDLEREKDLENAKEAHLKRLQKVLQAFTKVLLYVGSDKEPDKADPSQRKKIQDLSKLDSEDENALDESQIASIFNQFRAMLDVSVGMDIVHPWLANWLYKVLVSK